MAVVINSGAVKFMNARNICITGRDIGLLVHFQRSQKILPDIVKNKSWLFSVAPVKAAPLYSTSAACHLLSQNKHQWNVLLHSSKFIVHSSYANSSRFQSTSQTVEQSIQSNIIPDPPPVPDPLSSLQNVVEGVEPSLSSLGLGGWTPVGILQHCLELLHTSCNLPWWLSIAIGTLIVRICLFPLVIIAQRNSAKLNNNLPQMQLLQLKMSEARKSGNAIDTARYANELMLFMKTKNLNPLKNMIVPFAQAPVFISFFLALRKMANLPVESLKTGGIFWFTDLTVADPFYLLPIFTSATLFLTIELGAEGGMRSDSLQMARYIMRAIPIAILPFIIYFPSTVLCYWATSNFITLGQVAMLRLDPIRTYFNIPKLIRHSQVDLPMKKKGFVEGFKESYTNSKITRNLEDRSRIDEIRFRKAGIGPIEKTYPYDPTKQKPVQASASEKSQSTKYKM